MLLRQCRLKRSNAITIGWIEARGARIGAAVELPELGGFWQVTAVYDPPLAEKALREKQRVDHKGMPTG